MDADRVDLSALDPTLDPWNRRRLEAAILERAEPWLARRRAQHGPLAVLGAWSRPALATAALLSIAAGTALWRVGGEGAGPTSPIAEALAVPAPVIAWLEEGRTPTALELVEATEEEVPGW